MVVKRQSNVDHVHIRVTHEAPAGTSFVTLIQTDLDPLDDKSPTANNSTDCNGFNNPSNAHTTNGLYATAVADLGTFATMYKGFGFAIPAGNNITKVELVVKWNGNMTGITIALDVGTPGTPDTCGNFTSLASASVFDGGEGERIDILDVTSQRSWIPSDFDDNNLRLLLSALHGAI